MRPRTKRLVLAAVLAVVLTPFILGYAWWQHHYPYGMSHCCDAILYVAMNDYAIRHGGAFPAGEATPEASLSLLYREKMDGQPLADEVLLRGKTVPESVVRDILRRGELLTPDTCGWHYVEGLRIDDDYRLAILWDKIGLDHVGGRLAEGGQDVTFVGGQRKYIPEAEWQGFLAEQSKLWADRATAIHHDATIQIGNRAVNVQVRVVDDYIYGSTWNSGETIATTKKHELGIQGLPVIPIEEIKNAKVVVEQDKSRVRFVLKGREIIYDKSGFHVEATASEPQKK